MDLTKLSETELKALWFDQLATIERSQANINAIKQEFSNRQKESDSKKAEVGQEVKA